MFYYCQVFKKKVPRGFIHYCGMDELFRGPSGGRKGHDFPPKPAGAPAPSTIERAKMYQL